MNCLNCLTAFRHVKNDKFFGIKRREEKFYKIDVGCLNCLICEKTYIKDKMG